MKTRLLAPIAGLTLAASLFAQSEGPPPGFPPGPGGRGRGFGPPLMQETKLVAQFDRDGDKRLNAEEREAAREFHVANRASGRGFGRGPGGGFPGGRGRSTQAPAEPGEKIAESDVPQLGDKPLYDASALRTLFLNFESADWEREMEDFNNTDVDIPATLRVDGKSYSDIGVHFRGASSFMMVSRGYKRSLNLSIDFVHEDQSLLGFRTLNLLNSHEDASFLRSALYSHVAQTYLPTPRVNFVRVVINGENWGVYGNAEQFNKDFLKSRFGSSKGARWKVPGSPGGRGSLAYLGDDPSAYKRIYEIKSKDDAASWAKLIRVCKILNEASPDKLEAELAPYLDVDGALKFLALEVTFVNGDGYWTRTSDYSIGEDDRGRLHIIPHDMNETFSFGGGPMFGRGPGGPGMGPPEGRAFAGGPSSDGNASPPFPGGQGFGPRFGRGGMSGGVQLDPLVAADNPNAPLASRLLAVPALRTRYLSYVREMAEKWLDWSNLGPIARQHHELIDADVRRDTKKLESYEDFAASLESGPRSLKAFAEQRRAFLLSRAALKRD